MRVLALESYYGGSHKAFLDGWVANSRHDWTTLTLPANKWKWRMRHAAVTFAQQVTEQIAKGRSWDIIFCSDMLNLAEFLGLTDKSLRTIPSVVYFHENQLTYPVRFESERDYQFAMTNMTTALAAKQVWFNSAFHRDEFLLALQDFLKRMPDNQPIDSIEQIRAKSAVHPPGIMQLPPRGQRKPGPLRILWAGRWEHDKNPEDFFAAMKRLKETAVDFRLSIIGQHFREVPEVFGWAKGFFADQIDRWGYQQSRSEYGSALAEADVIVSTANHEFFGIGMVEAIAAGVYPVLPKRLAYPEIAGRIETVCEDEFLYDGTVDGLVQKLIASSERIERGDLWQGSADRGSRAMEKFHWRRLGSVLDDALGEMV